MKTINYKVKKEIIKIEVSDEFAIKYEEVTTEYKRNEWKHDRAYKRHISSYDELTDAGVQLEDKQPTLEDNIIKDEEYQTLYKAIKQLTSEQQKLVRDVFFNGKKQVEIAKEEGVDKRVIGKRLDRIYNHLKNILKNLTDR